MAADTATLNNREYSDSNSSDMSPTPKTPQDEEANDGANKENPELTRLETSQSSIAPPKNIWQEVVFVTVVCLGQFLTQGGLALSIPPAHITGESFNTSNPGELSWFPAAYSLTVGTFILVAGRLGDVYGHRLMFVAGFAWFGFWSLLAGFSVWSNQIFFDCCRAFQGIGPSLIMPNAVAIFGRTYPPGRRKAMVFCLFGACAPGGFLVTGAFASIIAQLSWWPWMYWIFGIVCFALSGLGMLVIPHMPTPKLNDGLSVVKRLDVLGACSGIAGLVLFNFAWNQAALVGWQTPYTYALLIVGFLCLGAFLFIEKSAECPLLPRSVLTGDLAWVLGCIATGWSSFGIIVYYYFQFELVILGNSPALSTAKFSGAAISGAIASITTGYLLGFVPPSVIMFCAMAAFTVGLCLFATVPVNQIYWGQTFFTSLITPWGMDMSFPSGILLLSNAMPKEHQGLAASLVATTVNYSISLGLGFAGTVESHVNEGGKNVLKGYRGALYMGIGLAGLGLFISSCYMFVSWRRSRRQS